MGLAHGPELGNSGARLLTPKTTQKMDAGGYQDPAHGSGPGASVFKNTSSDLRKCNTTLEQEENKPSWFFTTTSITSMTLWRTCQYL